jgi:hypothetical protein
METLLMMLDDQGDQKDAQDIKRVAHQPSHRNEPEFMKP